MKRPAHTTTEQPSIRAHLLRECQAMAKFALSGGLNVPGKTVQLLESFEVEIALKKGGQIKAGDSQMAQPPPPLPDPPGKTLKHLAQIHEHLARIVAPASPRTILLIEQESEQKGFLHFFGPVALVRRLMFIALLSLVALFAFSYSTLVDGKPASYSLVDGSGMKLLLNELFLLSAAGIGASFAALFQVSRYIKDFTFDPTHESSYWVRFVLGLVAGTILALLIPIEDSDTLSMNGLGKPLLALLGGFSANLVYRILNRLIGAVESLVSGDTRDLVHAREQEVKARQAEQASDTYLRIAAGLVRLQQKVSTGATSGRVTQEIDRILNDLNPNELDQEEDEAGETAPPEQVQPDLGEAQRPPPEHTESPVVQTEPPPPVLTPPAEQAPEIISPSETSRAPAAIPPPGAATAIGSQPTRYALLGAMSYAGVELRLGIEQNDETRTAARDLQRHLRALGYLRAGIDGAFGQGTEDAIRALQHDLLHNDGQDEHGGPDAPVRMIDYNRGRIAQVTGVADADTVACIQDILQDPNFVFLPFSESARDANARIHERIAEMTSDQAPIPILLAILEQESNAMHFCMPRGNDEDNYIVVGFDRNDTEAPYRITSRGYGAGQYTLFHHPPRQEEVEQFMLEVNGNLQRAVSLVREKFDRFITGSTSGLRSDDRIAEIGEGPLRLCKYDTTDPRYLKNCVACMQEAGTLTIESGTTPYFEGSNGVFETTQYHRHTRLEDVPVRANAGCDWPYAVRRYNGSGVNSYWYQAEVLLRIKSQDGRT